MPQVLRIVKAMAKFHAAAKTLIKIRTLELVKQVNNYTFLMTSLDVFSRSRIVVIMKKIKKICNVV